MTRAGPSDTVPLAGRVALVTGASRGIGRGIALALAREGMKVLATARSAAPLEDLAREAITPGTIVSAPADVTREADVAALFSRLESLWGAPHLVVNSAGVFLSKPAVDTTFEDWRSLIDTNLTATFLVSRAAARVMGSAGRGTIVNISSIGGRIGLAGKVAYSASKFGVVGLSRSLAKELAPKHVKVHVLYPHTVDSADEVDWGKEPDRTNILAVEDVARTVVFLASLPERFMIPELELNPLFRP